MIMETNYILAIIFWVVACVFAFEFGINVLLIEKQSVKDSVAISGIMLMVCAGAFVMALMWSMYKDGQIDALKGKYKYRMEINYDQHGIPKDTIYVKEKWRKNMEKDTVVIVPIRLVIDTVIYINR